MQGRKYTIEKSAVHPSGEKNERSHKISEHVGVRATISPFQKDDTCQEAVPCTKTESAIPSA
jgi:hypothetical protein